MTSRSMPSARPSRAVRLARALYAAIPIAIAVVFVLGSFI